MSREDFRVRVTVEFDIDVSAESRIDALHSAERITEIVFRRSFSRAEDVCVDAREVKDLKPESGHS